VTAQQIKILQPESDVEKRREGIDEVEEKEFPDEMEFIRGLQSMIFLISQPGRHVPGEEKKEKRIPFENLRRRRNQSQTSSLFLFVSLTGIFFPFSSHDL
jgi:hypothetical protein